MRRALARSAAGLVAAIALVALPACDGGESVVTPKNAKAGEDAGLVPVSPRVFPDRPTIAVLAMAGADRTPASLREGIAATIGEALAANPGIRTVDRSMLSGALQELSLSALLSPESKDLRLGQIVQADLLLRASLRGMEEDRVLSIHLIDRVHGDMVPCWKSPTKLSDSEMLTSLQAQLPAAIEAAILRVRAREKDVLVAPVLFDNSGPTDRLDYLRRDLPVALTRASRDGVTVLQFAEMEDAAAEGDLVLTGLADGDPEAWRQLADVYVWGEFRELSAGVSQHAVPAEEVPIEITLTAWALTGKQKTVTRQGTIGTIPELLAKLADDLHAVVRGSKTKAVSEPARDALCRQLIQSAMVRSGFGDRLLRMELAAFLAPTSRLALDHVMVAKINEAQQRPTLRSVLSAVAWAQRRQQRFPDNFGSLSHQAGHAIRWISTSDEGKALDPGRRAELECELMQQIRLDYASMNGITEHARAMAQGRVADVARVCDELAQERTELIAELWRIAKPGFTNVATKGSGIHRLEGDYLEPLVYKALKKVGRESEVEAMFRVDGLAPSASSEAGPRGRPSEVLADLVGHRAIFPGLEARVVAGEVRPPIVRVMESLSWCRAPVTYFHAGQRYDMGLQFVPGAIAVRKNLVWVSAVPAQGFSSPRLMRFDPATGETDVVSAISSETPVTCLLADERWIWAGTAGGGIYRIDPETLEATNFNVEKGLRSDFVESIATHEGRLLVSCRGARLSVMEMESGVFTDQPLAAGGEGLGTPSPGVVCVAGDWLLRETAPLLLNLKTGETRPISSLIGNGLERPPIVSTSATDGKQIWLILGEATLASFDSVNGTSRTWALPQDREYRLIPAGDLLLVIVPGAPQRNGSTEGTTEVLVLNATTGLWAGRFGVLGSVTLGHFEAATGWLAGDGFMPLARVNLEPVFASVKLAVPRPAGRQPSPDRVRDLLRASYAGDRQRAMELIGSGVDPNAAVGKYTAARAAASNDQVEVLKALMPKQAAQDRRLMFDLRDDATRSASMGVLQLLVELGEKPAVTGAALAGDIEAVRYLLSKGCDQNQGGPMDDLRHYTYLPVTHAIRQGNHELLRELIAAKPSAASVGSALRSAIEVRDIAAAKLVLEALPDLTDVIYLKLSLASRCEEMTELLLGQYDAELLRTKGSVVLSEAITAGSAKQVTRLLGAGVDPNVTHAGMCFGAPLVAAAAYGDMGAIEELLRRGAKWETPLGEKRVLDHAFAEAATGRHFYLAAQLLEQGADVNTQNADGEPALIALAGFEPNARLMIAWGADPGVRTSRGQAAAERAVGEMRKILEQSAGRKGGPSPWLAGYLAAKATIANDVNGLGEALRDWGVLPDLRDLNDGPLVVLAARNGSNDCLRLLLKSGAAHSMTGVNDAGWTALMEAAKRGDREAVTMLLDAGAERNRSNEQGQLPWMIARDHGHQELAEILRPRPK